MLQLYELNTKLLRTSILYCMLQSTNTLYLSIFYIFIIISIMYNVCTVHIQYIFQFIDQTKIEELLLFLKLFLKSKYLILNFIFIYSIHYFI